MTMGPFTVAKAKDGGYTVNDRFSDPAAHVDTHEHGQEWVKRFYQTLGLEERFLGIDSQFVQRLVQDAAEQQRERNIKARALAKQALAAARAEVKRTKPRRHRKGSTTKKQLQLSCGARVFLECAA